MDPGQTGERLGGCWKALSAPGGYAPFRQESGRSGSRQSRAGLGPWPGLVIVANRPPAVKIPPIRYDGPSPFRYRPMRPIDERILRPVGPAVSGPITLELLAALAGCQVVPVVHPGWPLGLVVDPEGEAWKLGPLGPDGRVPLRRADDADLEMELRRLLGWGCAVHAPVEEDLALAIPQIRDVTLPCLKEPVMVGVAKAVGLLARLPESPLHEDSGYVLLHLDRGGAVWVHPPAPPLASDKA